MAMAYFRSGNGQDKQVRSTTGHSFLIGDKPVAVPDIGPLHDDCMKAGCYIVDGFKPEEMAIIPITVDPDATNADAEALAAAVAESDELFPVPAPKSQA